MKQNTSPLFRPAARIDASRWGIYAAAGAATALTAAGVAEAGTITYSGPINLSFNAAPNSAVGHTFPLAGGAYFGLLHNRFSNQQPPAVSSYAGARFSLIGIFVTEGFRRAGGSSVAKLLANQNLSAGPFQPRSLGRLALFDRFSGPPLSSPFSYSVGEWRNQGTGFIGFEFNTGIGIQYGWARVTMDGAANHNSFTLVDYAFGSPGQQIRTGQTAVNVPESGNSLGLLALGAAGLFALRRRRAVVTN